MVFTFHYKEHTHQVPSPSSWEGEKERKMEVNNHEPTGHAIVFFLKNVVLTSQITIKVAITIGTLFTDIP
jgi:hypothetical protein